jgi:hypothetical protein
MSLLARVAARRRRSSRAEDKLREPAVPVQQRCWWGRRAVQACARGVRAQQRDRSHGSTMGLKLRRFCNGTKFRYVFY